MEEKLLKRYLILIGILLICAAAAWFITGAEEVHEDAVLVQYTMEKTDLEGSHGTVYERVDIDESNPAERTVVL